MSDRLRIGEVARQAGVNVQTLPLLRAPATPGEAEAHDLRLQGVPGRDGRLIRFIKRAQDLGFTLNEVKGLVALRDAKGRKRREVRAVADARVRDIERKLAELEAMRSALLGLVEGCACGDEGPPCPIIEALDNGHGAARSGDATEASRSS